MYGGRGHRERHTWYAAARHAGRERVRQAFARVFELFPDARFGAARHFIAGDRGVSEWRFTGTTAA